VISRIEFESLQAAAYAGYSNTTGSLTPGKRFDAVIWDDDLMTVDQGEMLEVKVKATLLDGQLVFGSVAA
jgi:predicted amidohydrolase YtcJ